MPITPYSEQKRAYVVFTDKTTIPMLGVLTRGFRHCFVLLHNGLYWTRVEPMANRMHIDVFTHLDPAYDLPDALRTQGHAVIEAKINYTEDGSLFTVLSCVSVVKRIIGLHKPLIQTPFQLYQHLSKEINHG